MDNQNGKGSQDAPTDSRRRRCHRHRPRIQPAGMRKHAAPTGNPADNAGSDGTRGSRQSGTQSSGGGGGTKAGQETSPGMTAEAERKGQRTPLPNRGGCNCVRARCRSGTGGNHRGKFYAVLLTPQGGRAAEAASGRASPKDGGGGGGGGGLAGWLAGGPLTAAGGVRRAGWRGRGDGLHGGRRRRQARWRARGRAARGTATAGGMTRARPKGQKSARGSTPDGDGTRADRPRARQLDGRRRRHPGRPPPRGNDPASQRAAPRPPPKRSGGPPASQPASPPPPPPPPPPQQNGRAQRGERSDPSAGRHTFALESNGGAQR